jgi:hypothetical protein
MTSLADLAHRIRFDAAYLRGSIHAADHDVAADLDEVLAILDLAREWERLAVNDGDDERAKRHTEAADR